MYANVEPRSCMFNDSIVLRTEFDFKYLTLSVIAIRNLPLRSVDFFIPRFILSFSAYVWFPHVRHLGGAFFLAKFGYQLNGKV